jgi:hypothetical protein
MLKKARRPAAAMSRLSGLACGLAVRAACGISFPYRSFVNRSFNLVYLWT